MPRTLARNGYTQEQVWAALQADTGLISSRFDLVDRDYKVITSLDVVSAVVDWDGTRTIPRSLRMTMLPRTDLLSVPFRYLVKPYFIVGMPDGGQAEFPMGAYVFTAPTRMIGENAAPGSGTSDTAGNGLAPENPELWNLTLGDQMHIVDAGGVGPQGFTIAQGARVTDGITALLSRLNFKDSTGVAPSNAVTSDALSWSLVTGGQRTSTATYSGVGWQSVFVPGPFMFGASQYLNGEYYLRYEEVAVPWSVTNSTSTALEDPATTWSHVAKSLHTQLGYEPPWFDLDNDRYIARPSLDYSQLLSAPIIFYEAGQDSMLMPGFTSTPDLTKIANRATVTARNAGGTPMVGVADLNDLIPGHPLSQGVLGFYIEATSTSTVAADQLQVNAQATALLQERLRTYETVPIVSMCNPAHDAWEIVSLRVPNDAVYDTPQLMAEKGWALDLMTGQQNHLLTRLGVAAVVQ